MGSGTQLRTIPLGEGGESVVQELLTQYPDLDFAEIARAGLGLMKDLPPAQLEAVLARAEALFPRRRARRRRPRKP